MNVLRFTKINEDLVTVPASSVVGVLEDFVERKLLLTGGHTVTGISETLEDVLQALDWQVPT